MNGCTPEQRVHLNPKPTLGFSRQRLNGFGLQLKIIQREDDLVLYPNLIFPAVDIISLEAYSGSQFLVGISLLWFQ